MAITPAESTRLAAQLEATVSAAMTRIPLGHDAARAGRSRRASAASNHSASQLALIERCVRALTRVAVESPGRGVPSTPPPPTLGAQSRAACFRALAARLVECLTVAAWPAHSEATDGGEPAAAAALEHASNLLRVWRDSVGVDVAGPPSRPSFPPGGDALGAGGALHWLELSAACDPVTGFPAVLRAVSRLGEVPIEDEDRGAAVAAVVRSAGAAKAALERVVVAGRLGAGGPVRG